jgi:hypothetical protein
VTHAQVKQWEAESRKHREACGRIREAGKWHDLKIDKKLKVQGPRRFKGGLLGWSEASRGEAVRSVALRWEHAYGGHSLARNERGEEILNKVWFANPLGCGWLHTDWEKALEKARQGVPKTLPAPQLSYPEDAVDWLERSRTPADADTARKMGDFIREKARHRPANFGWVGRSWSPRLEKAGTYDEVWKKEVWPKLPKDFDFGYWNGAPEDQQMGFPESGFSIGLRHLINPEKSGTDEVIARLPEHRAFVLARLGGVLLPFPMQIDTMVIDTEEARVDLVWRTGILRELEPEKLELRFETDPGSPLLKWRGKDGA